MRQPPATGEARMIDRVGEALTAIEPDVPGRVSIRGEIWTAVDASTIPVSEEERLRGGDRKIEACLYVETLRVTEAEKIAGALSETFPAAATGVYRLLCEVRPA